MHRFHIPQRRFPVSTQSTAVANIHLDDPVFSPVLLSQWQDVPFATLLPFAPADSVPMAQYAVTTVMLWGQAQGFAGAIPTWEIGDGCWGVICLMPNPDITLVEIPITSFTAFDASDTAGWAQSVMRWATGLGYQMAIPTFQATASSVTALLFSAAYPGLFPYNAPNSQLFQVLGQSGKLCNLQDPAVWANSVMRTATSIGYVGGWPTWEWTTYRGLIGISGYYYGPLPEASDTNVSNVLAVLNQTVAMLEISTVASLADFSGIYTTFTAAPISDPGLEILVDCIFGAIQIGLNLIPGVGGAIASLVAAAVTVAQDAANVSGGGGGTYTLEEYQKMLSAASDATINYVAGVHDTLMDSQTNGTLQQVWAENYANPISGCSTQLGMLALAPDDVVNGLSYWTTLGQEITAQLNQNLMVSITAQLYTVQYRTYANAPAGKQWWYGTYVEVTAADGDVAQYIASSDDDLSVWFNNAVAEPGHARGPYVTFTEWWLQASAGSVVSEYPPSILTYGLFSSDGFNNTTNWVGPFSKQNLYTQWLMTQSQNGVGYTQTWSYTTSGYLVYATISDANGESAMSGFTDEYGNLTVNSSNQIVEAANSQDGLSQPVIINYLVPLDL
jgi:hypothetical protein